MRNYNSFEENENASESRRTSINSILAILITLGMMLLGVNSRESALNATTLFNDRINGISGQIPAQWLLDNNSSNYVFRAMNIGGLPYKTTLQVTTQTIGSQATPRHVVDMLNVQGPAKLSGYSELGTQATYLGEDEALQITYTFVETESNPFLQSAPTVVAGIDLVVIRGNQAIIFTYRDAIETFEQNRFYFDNFLRTVEY